jgi:hypothetical protein
MNNNVDGSVLFGHVIYCLDLLLDRDGRWSGASKMLALSGKATFFVRISFKIINYIEIFI